MRSPLSRRIGGSLAIAAITSTAALVAVPAAQAAVEHPDLARSMFADPAVVVSSSFPHWYHQDTKVALGTAPTGGFPRTTGGDFAVLSSGRASNVFGTRLSDSYYGAPSRGDFAFDAETIKVDIVVPDGVNCLTGLDFQVASTEAPGGRPSGFVAELDETTWTAQADEGIKAPGNFAGLEGGTPVGPAVTSGPAAMKSDAIGSYPSSTGVLTASTPITPGAHSLYLSVFDAATAYTGTSVLIDDIRFGYVDEPAGQCAPGARTAVKTATTQAPTKQDDWGTQNDRYTIPAVEGVRYLVDGVPTAAGTYPGDDVITVTTEAEEGYVLEGDTLWRFGFSEYDVADHTSSGVGTAPQSVTVNVPKGGTLTLIDSDVEAGTIAVRGKGSFHLDETGSTISFTPAAGFAGDASVTFEVTDIEGKRAQRTYTATVTRPVAPAAAPVTSTGPAGTGQQVNIPVPPGGTLKLVDVAGHPVDAVLLQKQGTYRVVQDSITFTPVKGFSGKAGVVKFRVTDAYGQSGTASYGAVVKTAPKPGIRTSARTVNATQLKTVCTLTTEKIRTCSVTALAVVGGQRVTVGSGKVKTPGTSREVSVPVKLNKLGRALAARPNGVAVTLKATVTGTDKLAYQTAGRTRVVAPAVELRPVYFRTDSARLSTADRAYLLGVRKQLGAVKGVVCAGYADARSTVRYNAALGKARAKAVCEVLTQGVKAKVTTASRGETRPAASNGTREGRALNRRVEVDLKY